MNTDARPDLSFVTTSEMVEELGKRFAGFAMVGDEVLSSSDKADEERYGMTFYRHGASVAHIYGLLEYAMGMVLHQMEEIYEEVAGKHQDDDEDDEDEDVD